jgi:hypothetical protein
MKSTFVLALGMLLASTAFAQPPEKPNEVFVGFGDAGLIFALEDVVTTVFTLGTVTYGDQEGGLQVVAGYQRRFGSWAGLGVTGSWAGAKKTMRLMGNDAGRVERRLLTLMVDGRAHWLRRPRVELYSGLAFGFTSLGDEWAALAEEEDLNGVGFHAIPIGIRFGRDVGGFLETGVGYHGFLKAGLSARL